ncbi:MAG: hypothetical protein NVSMB69_04910 [Novosphingobium sp.]
MADDHLDTAVERLDAALARIEAALVGQSSRPSADAVALAALEQRHAALRQVMSDSIRELDGLLAVAEPTALPESAAENEGGR